MRSEEDNPLIAKLYQLVAEQPLHVEAVQNAYFELRKSETMDRRQRKKVDAVLQEYYWKVKKQSDKLDAGARHHLTTLKLQVDCDCAGY
jgi:hypothetical protein